MSSSDSRRATSVYFDDCFNKDRVDRENSPAFLPNDSFEEYLPCIRETALTSDPTTVGLEDGGSVFKKLAEMRRDFREAIESEGLLALLPQSLMPPTTSNFSLRVRSGPRELLTGPIGSDIIGRCRYVRLGMLTHGRRSDVARVQVLPGISILDKMQMFASTIYL